MVSKDFIYRIKLEVNMQKVKLNCGNTFKKNGVKGKTNLKLYYFRKKDQVSLLWSSIKFRSFELKSAICSLHKGVLT